MEPVTPSVDLSHGDLRVHPSGRYLVHADGTPFLYLGDTAWELFHRLSREEVDLYLDDRARKRFTAVQAVALAEFDGLDEPNVYGEKPFRDASYRVPNEAYFEHVDYVVRKAGSVGLVIGLLPTWGDKATRMWGIGPEIFGAAFEDQGLDGAEARARLYGGFLGRRYRDVPNLIWILGGDRPPDDVVPVWRAMANGIFEGDGGRHLRTYHPMGGQTSSTKLHDEPWLDFNMCQSGHHAKGINNATMIAHDYALVPAKPCLDGEPNYEDHPVNWDPANGWFDDADVRRQLYRSVFAGAAGVTYGCQDIWQMRSPKREPIAHARTNWQDALQLPGAQQVRHLRGLMETHGPEGRVPDMALVPRESLGDPQGAVALRGPLFALIYLPTARAIAVDLRPLPEASYGLRWFDPTTGRTTEAGNPPGRTLCEVAPPASDTHGDWVLIVGADS